MSNGAPSPFGVVLFQSVHGAMAAEGILASLSIEHKIVPVPRHLSSDCGFCLRFRWEDRLQISRALDSQELGITGMEKI